MHPTRSLSLLCAALGLALAGGCTLAGDVRPYQPMAPIQPLVVPAAAPSAGAI